MFEQESLAQRSRRMQQQRADSLRTGVYVPPGWPEMVRPPGSPGWERTAVVFLLDCCPADYRGYPVLQRHPIVLARFAHRFVEGQLAATKSNLAGLRASLADHVDRQVLDHAADVLLTEDARLVRVRRAVSLVEEALAGVEFRRRL